MKSYKTSVPSYFKPMSTSMSTFHQCPKCNKCASSFWLYIIWVFCGICCCRDVDTCSSLPQWWPMIIISVHWSVSKSNMLRSMMINTWEFPTTGGRVWVHLYVHSTLPITLVVTGGSDGFHFLKYFLSKFYKIVFKPVPHVYFVFIINLFWDFFILISFRLPYTFYS